MKNNILGKSGIAVSPVGFGVLTIGKTQLDLPLDEGADLIRYAIRRGINFLDTAQFYETYPYIERALKGTELEPVIASKCLDAGYDEMRFAVEEARSQMDRDVIDIFLLHEVRNDPDWQNRQPAWEYLNDAKAKGIIKAIGVSTHHVDVAEKMTDIEECDILFPLINIKSLGIRQGNGPGKKEDMAAAIKACSRKGMGVFAMKAFGGGNLTGSYIECLDYVTGLSGISSVMIGFGKHEEVDRAIEYAEGKIDRNYVPDISKKMIHIDTGDCEGCGNCIKKCPNHAISFGEKPVCGYEDLAEKGKVVPMVAEVDHSICLTCGYCAPVCPVRAIIMW